MIYVKNIKTHYDTDHDFYIGRGSVLGNPFTHLPPSVIKMRYRDFVKFVPTREDAITAYRKYLLDKLDSKDKAICDAMNVIYKMAKTGDVNLLCYCVPKLCHGEIIKEIIEKQLRNELELNNGMGKEGR